MVKYKKKKKKRKGEEKKGREEERRREGNQKEGKRRGKQGKKGEQKLLLILVQFGYCFKEKCPQLPKRLLKCSLFQPYIHVMLDFLQPKQHITTN